MEGYGNMPIMTVAQPFNRKGTQIRLPMGEIITQPSLFEIKKPVLSWDCLIPTFEESVTETGGRLVLCMGHEALFTVGHYLLVWRALQERVFWVDNANVFDLSFISRLAKELKQDVKQLLERIHISRAFTIHQLQSLISDRLETDMKKNNSRLCFISGLLDGFFDEEVSAWEAEGVLRQVVKKLRLLIDKGYKIIVLAPNPKVAHGERKGFSNVLSKSADRILILSNPPSGLVLERKA